MRICIHRGTHEIGGTCIELEAGGKRIVLDIGLPLDTDPGKATLPGVSGFTEFDPSLLGIYISHPHLDHYGLLSKVLPGVPVMIGPGAVKIIRAAGAFIPSAVGLENTVEIANGVPISLGPFTITPYLVDHSAYDSYALLVEAEGRRVFYSGDFRAHGRKAALFDRLVEKPPPNIDVLLMEGSTMGREDCHHMYPTEAELEERFKELFSSTAGMALVWSSGQNIDRLVTLYRAARAARREFISDMYTAHVLRSIGNPRLPQPGWAGFRVFLPWVQKQRIIKSRAFELAGSFAPWRIYPEQLKETAHRSVMLFRPSMKVDLEKAECLDGCSLIYSLWPGYLEDTRYRPFLKWLEDRSIPLTHCHTSGHAPLSDLKRLSRALSPKQLVPIHSFEPERFVTNFENVVLREDGEWW